MKLQLSEIWDFIRLMQDQEIRWEVTLVAGEVVFEGLTVPQLALMKSAEDFDQELLPSIFTYREILWQPNVYEKPNLCLPGLRLLQAYCSEFTTQNEAEGNANSLFHTLLNYLVRVAEDAIKSIEEEGQPNLGKVLGNFRRQAFPVIQFFLWHPANKSEHVVDAQKRLDYAVKIMLTQYYNQYSELMHPFWLVKKIVASAPSEKGTKTTEANPREEN